VLEVINEKSFYLNFETRQYLMVKNMAEGRTVSTSQVNTIKSVVKSLLNEAGVKGVIITDETGLPICSVGNIEEKSELVLSNTVLGTFVESLKMFSELGIPYLDNIIIESTNLKAYISSEEEGKAFIAVFCTPETNIALLKVLAKKVLEEIHKVLVTTSRRAEEFFTTPDKLTWLTPEERKKWREIAGTTKLFLGKTEKKK